MLSTQVPEIAQARVDTADLAPWSSTLGSYADPTTPTESHLAKVLAGIVGVQCHSHEDSAFKSDRITIGPGATLGVGAFVHYGVTIGHGAVLAPDFFLMKGEEIPLHTRWGGNPARETRQ